MLTAFDPLLKGVLMASSGAVIALVTISTVALAAIPAQAADPPAAAGHAGDSGLSINLDVIAKQLDIARQQIQPSLGATTYNFSPQALEDVPQGDNAPLQPGAAAGPRRGTGQLWPDPSARRACQRAVPPERRGTAGRAIGIRSGDEAASPTACR